MSASIRDWLDGQVIDLSGRKKILMAAGVLSRSGDARRHFAGFSRHLQRVHGFSEGDFLEATYRGRLVGEQWTPERYEPSDCEAPLGEGIERMARLLRWYDARLPLEQELHLLGYSLGGVLLFGAALEVLTNDLAHWSRRVRSVITVSSPLFGTDLGVEGELLGLFGLRSLLPAGAVGQELTRLGGDPEHRRRVERQADYLRSAGVRVVTLADENDTVVTPEDAVIAPPAERQRFVLNSPRAAPGGRYGDSLLGHGPILDDPRAWAIMASAIGPQEPRSRTAGGAIAL